MSDPYYLRKANIDDLDLSKYEKDYKPEELAAVKEALNAEKQKHEEQFNNLPFAERAKYHASDVIDYAQQNPEAFLGIPAAAVLFGAGKAVAEKGSEAAKKVHGSLRDFMSSKTADEGLLATQQAEKKVESTVPTQPAKTPAKTLTNPKPELPTGVTAETDVGNRPKDMALVERSEQNKMSKEAAAAAPKGSAPAPVIKTESVVPEGMHPQYKPNPKKGIMGPSAFNHLANNIGFEKAIQVWEDRYGKTNVPYKEFMAEYEKAAGKQMHGPVKPLAEGAKPGGSFGKPEFVPEYIRGSAPIEAMGRSALAALGILPVAKKIKEGDYKGALNEAIPASALIDPRISLALSPLYTSEEEIAILKKAEQARKTGAGRGVAPPSAYMR
jgi:hypothetical protein